MPKGTPIYIITVHEIETACTRGVGDAAPYKRLLMLPAWRIEDASLILLFILL